MHGISLARSLERHSPEFLRTAYHKYAKWRSWLASANNEFLRFPPGNFYSPLPDLTALRGHSARIFNSSVDDVQGVQLNEVAQLELVERFAAHYDEMPFPHRRARDSRYYLDNRWYSYGDGITLYSMLRVHQPKRIIEVGSGYSSAALLEINDRFFDGNINLTFIEPHPNRLRELLHDEDVHRCTILVKPVQDVPTEVFGALRSGDILLIDSSHVAKIDSDVLHLFFRILPVLNTGVVVHFHDILWPFEYPKNWLEKGRAWNEAYMLRAFLQYNREFEIVYFNSFMAVKHADVLGRMMPLVLQDPSAPVTPGNSSLWLRKNSLATPQTGVDIE
ncbi:MAG: class I SAM-dependent methyltransferase [Pseudonocardiaceae bacterium]